MTTAAQADLTALDDLKLIDAEAGLHKMYGIRKSADLKTDDVEAAHGLLAAEMRKRHLIYEPLVKKYDPDHDGDDDASPSGDTDHDYAGKKKKKGVTQDATTATSKAQSIVPGQTPPAAGAPGAPAPGGGAPGAPVPGKPTGAASPAQAPDVNALTGNQEYTPEERMQMAEQGLAMPDGSMPIANEADLHRSIGLVGQHADPQAAMQHIIQRSHSMGMPFALPPAWRQNSGVSSPPAPPAAGAHSMPGPGATPQPGAPGAPGAAGKKPLAKRIGEAVAKALGAQFDVEAFEDALDMNLDPQFGYAVVKSASEERFTLGPIYLPGTYDAHDEWATAEDLRKSVHDYVDSTASTREVFLQHSSKVAGHWIEIVSWPQEVTATMQKSIDGVVKSEAVTLPAGTPYLGVVWEPWAWEMVKAKKITGFSMGGFARRTEAEIA